MSEPATLPAVARASNKPDETSAFKQQRMAAWQPIMSPPYVIACFIAVAVIFIPIGAAVIVASDKVIEIVTRYDTFAPDANNVISFTIEVPSRMTPPVFMYYQLDSFYQNHRRYAKSRSDPQLSGDTGASLTDCDPFTSPGQYLSPPSGFPMTVVTKPAAGATTGLTVDVTTVNYLPCGLIAWSMFNDTIQLYKTASPATTSNLICDGGNFDAAGNILDATIPTYCDKKGIAWPSDPGTKFVSPPRPQPDPAVKPLYLGHGGWNLSKVDNTQTYCLDECVANGWYVGERGHVIPDPADEDLMVWMRLASLSTFRKLYRKVNIALEVGTYRVNVKNNFPVSSFKGKKQFILTTTEWIGGRNYVLGGLYIATGILSLFFGMGFLAKHITTPRRIGALQHKFPSDFVAAASFFHTNVNMLIAHVVESGAGS